MLQQLRRVIFRSVAFLVAQIYDLAVHTCDRWNIYIRRLAYVDRGVFEGTAAGRNAVNLAIVAINPTDESIWTTRNLLNALLSNGFFVIVIANKQSEAIRSRLLDACHLYAERYPVGRDFGTYKFALRKWPEKVQNAEVLVLANDSLWYPASFKDTVSDLLSNDATWLALFESYQIHYHTQSFFQIFRREVIHSQAFTQYWRKYIPYSSRTYTIRAGEIGLAAALRKGGFFPHVAYTANRIIRAVLADADDNGHLSRVLAATFGAKDRETLGYTAQRRSAGPQINCRADAVYLAELGRKIAKKVENTNPTHGVGLLANYLLNAPLKRDLAYRGRHQIGELVFLASGYSDDELALMERDMRRRGIPPGIRGIRLMLFYYGRI